MINTKTPEYRALQFQIHRLNQQVYEQKLTIERLEAALQKERSARGWERDMHQDMLESERCRNGGW